MARPTVEFIGNELGQHGPNVFYKEFSVSSSGETRNFKLGDFYFVRKQTNQPICIAEFQLIWFNLKDQRKLALVKLYFRPEDIKTGRRSDHGEDELVEADRCIAINCDQAPSWECQPDVTFGKRAYEGLENTNGFVTQHKDSQEQKRCCCRLRNGHLGKKRTPVKVLSFSAYCRYRTCVRILSAGRSMRRDLMAARGAVEVDCPSTRILFCRFQFQHPDIDGFGLVENIRVPVFKGRPRKRKISREKNNTSNKRTRGEKENAEPESNSKNDHSLHPSLSRATPTPPCSQTYRIISPLKKDPDRNVIYVRLETRHSMDPGVKKETNAYCITDALSKSKLQDLSKPDAINGLKLKIGKINDKFDVIQRPAVTHCGRLSNNEREASWETRQVNASESENMDAPSELVKRGKTGTVLDETFFREMRKGAGNKAGEAVDKEKMKKILEESCKDVEKFKDELYKFMKQRGTPIIYVPKVGYTRVNLPKLFQVVVANGGYKQVTLSHKWKKIYDAMVLATTITSAATCMRRHYEKLLLPYEKYLRTKHRSDASPQKTYSVTSQATQPLVLTIKTITDGGSKSEFNQVVNASKTIINPSNTEILSHSVNTRNFALLDKHERVPLNSQPGSLAVTATPVSIGSLVYVPQGLSAPSNVAKSIDTMYTCSSMLQAATASYAISSNITLTTAVSSSMCAAQSTTAINVPPDIPRGAVPQTLAISNPLRLKPVSATETSSSVQENQNWVSSISNISSSIAQSNMKLNSIYGTTANNILVTPLSNTDPIPCAKTQPSVHLSSVTSSTLPTTQIFVLNSTGSGAAQKEVSVITRIKSPGLQSPKPIIESSRPIAFESEPIISTSSLVRITSKPKVINCRPEIMNSGPGLINDPTGIIDNRLLIVNSNQAISNIRPVTMNGEPETVRSVIISTKPVSVNHKPLTVSCKTVTLNSIPVTISSKSFMVNSQPSTDISRPEAVNPNPPLVKRKRGRPRKITLENIKPARKSLQAGSYHAIHRGPSMVNLGINNHVSGTPNIAKITSMPMTQQLAPAATCSAITTTDNAVKPVKVYKCVMATDSMQVKLVKQEQSGISVPQSPAVDNATQKVSYMQSIAGLNLKDSVADIPARIANTSSESIYAADTAINSDGIDAMKMIDESYFSERPLTSQPSETREHNKMQRDFSLNGTMIKQESMPYDFVRNEEPCTSAGPVLVAEEIERKPDLQLKSVIVGPPPLVPISKSETPSKTIHPSYSAEATVGVTATNFRSLARGTDLRSNKEVTHISLTPDFKTMRDSLDAHSVMKPLSKKIDDSLEDLRRAAVAGFRPKSEDETFQLHAQTEHRSKKEYLGSRAECLEASNMKYSHRDIKRPEVQDNKSMYPREDSQLLDFHDKRYFNEDRKQLELQDNQSYSHQNNKVIEIQRYSQEVEKSVDLHKKYSYEGDNAREVPIRYPQEGPNLHDVQSRYTQEGEKSLEFRKQYRHEGENVREVPIPYPQEGHNVYEVQNRYSHEGNKILEIRRKNHHEDNMAESHHRRPVTPAYEQLRIDVDNHGYYSVPTREVEYRKHHDGRESNITRVYNDRRDYAEQGLLHVKDERNHRAPGEMLDKRGSSADVIIRRSETGSAEFPRHLHRQSPLQNYSELNHRELRDFKSYEQSKVVYEGIHPSNYESKHEGLLLRAGLSKASFPAHKSLHASEIRVKEAASVSPTHRYSLADRDYVYIAGSMHNRKNTRSVEPPQGREHFHSVEQSYRESQSMHKEYEPRLIYREKLHAENFPRESRVPLPVQLEPPHIRGHGAIETLQAGRRSGDLEASESYYAPGYYASYQHPNGLHLAEYHHSVASAYGRGGSPTIEHSRMMMGDLPSPNAMHHPWYGHHHPTATTAANTAVFWQQQVHH